MDFDLLVIHYHKKFFELLKYNISLLEKFNPGLNVYIVTHLDFSLQLNGNLVLVKCLETDSIGRKRNLLLESSRKGSVKMFIDEDDVQLPYRLKKQYDYMISNNLTVCSPRKSLIFDTGSGKCFKMGSSSVIEGCLMIIGDNGKRFVERNRLEGYPFFLDNGFGYYDEPVELYIQLKHLDNTVFKQIPLDAKVDLKVLNYLKKINTIIK